MTSTEQKELIKHTIEELSDPSSYKSLFHQLNDDDSLPSIEALKHLVDLCRAVLFPGYFSNSRISMQTIQNHIGVNTEKLFAILKQEVHAGLCFADKRKSDCACSSLHDEAAYIAAKFISMLPEIRKTLATDIDATYQNDPAAQNLGEVIFCYPGIRAIVNYRIAHALYTLSVPYIPRIISEMAHSETGIDIHPAAQIGSYFSIDHGTGIVIGQTSIIGNHVRLYQGVSLAGQPDSAIINRHSDQRRHPLLEDYVTVYSNASLLGNITIGKGATIYGNVWVSEDVAPSSEIKQNVKTI